MPKRKPILRAKGYPLMMQCVEVGVALGWNRAHKHDDSPSESHIRDTIERAVLEQISEAFSFEEDA